MAARFVTIEPSGGDYTSLSAAEAGEQAIGNNLVSAGDTLEFQYQGDWSAGGDTTATTINGFTTGASNWIKVSVDSANRHAGVWDAAKARTIVAGASIAVTVNDLYVTFDGLQIEQTGGAECIRQAELGGLIDACILRGRQAIGVTGGTAAVLVRNTLMADGSVEAMRRGISINTSTATGRCHNVTYVGTANSSTNPAFCSSAVGAALVTNNCLFKDTSAGTPVGWGGTGAASISGDNNASSDATPPGASSISSAAFTFENEGGGDFRLAAGDTSGALTGGQDLSADATLPVTVDVNGVTRPATPTIGYSQIAGGGPADPIEPAEPSPYEHPVAALHLVPSEPAPVAHGTAAAEVVPGSPAAESHPTAALELLPGSPDPEAHPAAALTVAPAAPVPVQHGTAAASVVGQQPAPVAHSTATLALVPSAPAATSHAVAAVAILPTEPTPEPHPEAGLGAGAIEPSAPIPVAHPVAALALVPGAPLTVAHAVSAVTLLPTAPTPVEHPQASVAAQLDPIPYLSATWAPGLVLSATHAPGLTLSATWSQTQ